MPNYRKPDIRKTPRLRQSPTVRRGVPAPPVARPTTLPKDLREPIFYGWRKAALVLAIISVLMLIAAIVITSNTTKYVQDERMETNMLSGLPSYITYDMVKTAVDMQAQYGHPAGATIGQIILESGQKNKLSELAERDHNLFGIKWSDDFQGEHEVTGFEEWITEEEYGSEKIVIEGKFATFANDADCIIFRSRYFLQPSRYSQNPHIKKAMANKDSYEMAQGLADAGWATATSYAEALKAVIKQYDLTRLDRLTPEDFNN